LNQYTENKVQFGLAIPQGWRGGDLPLQQVNDPVKQYEFSKSMSIAADNIGFDSIYAYDHLVPFYRNDLNKNIFECLTLLSSVTTITKRIKIGQIVTCNSYRNPSLLAKIISTLDVISQGRSELGIGAGWYGREYEAYGYDFPSHATRISQLDEALTIIKAMWSNERSASFEGKYFRIIDATCNPKPIQKPHPIIMIGGSGEKYLLKVAAKHADRYNLFFGSPIEMKRKISVLKEYCKSLEIRRGINHNKDIQYSVVLPCIVRDSEEEVNQVIVQHKRKDKTVEQYIKDLVGGITIGVPERIVKGINEYLDIGVTHFVFQFVGLDEKALKLFYSKVIRKVS
jgi:alkanesulfonate monooxygenase SsuD/methylene tetrahydromethanopterin reductase-like flavin-dependent oxidoreductase (luciferase family)